MDESIPESWREALEPVLRAPETRRLFEWLAAEERDGKSLYPPREQRMRALHLTPLDQVRVVILGQDPYHGPGQAHGLAFSVPDGVRLPPSLSNINRELEADCGVTLRSGNLEHWARQGVLLLNTALSVEAGLAGSHAGRGWEAITDAVVSAVAAREEPSAFILWGNHARAKAQRVQGLMNGDAAGRHLVLASAHPSPLSARRGFFGSRPFSRANAFLEAHGRGAIAW